MEITDNNVKWKVKKVGGSGSSEINADALKGIIGIDKGGTSVEELINQKRTKEELEAIVLE